jgi:hypothetical protein
MVLRCRAYVQLRQRLTKTTDMSITTRSAHNSTTQAVFTTPVPPVDTAVIRDLEQKLCAKYQCDLAENLQEKTKIEAKFLFEK